VCGTLWPFRPHRPAPDTPPPPATVLRPAPRRIRHKLIQNVATYDGTSVASTNNSTREATELPTETEDLTREEINAYLTQKNHSADSLVAAYRLTFDTNFLKEAAAKYPTDPHVQFTVLRKELFPEDRWHWLEAYEESTPDNSLVNYLAAYWHLKEGQTEQALAEFTRADAKPRLDVYWLDEAQAVSEAYMSAGFAPADARLEGIARSMTPIFPLLVQRDISALAVQYQQSGDPSTANSLTAMELRLGERLITGDAGKSLENEFIGYTLQRTVLTSLDPSTAVEFGGTTETAAERLADLRTKAKSIYEVVKAVPIDELVASHTMSDDDVLAYFEHVRSDGEFAAMQWLRDKLGPSLPSQPSASERK
jgi:hypothetical protein